MKAYSLDLRRRVLAAVDAGELTRAQLVATFSVSASWVRRLLQRRRQTGSIEPRPQRHGPAPRLDEPRLRRLADLVARQPDATLAELRGRLGEPVSAATVGRALRKLGLVLKKSPSGRRSRTGPTWPASGPSTGRRSRGSTRAG